MGNQLEYIVIWFLKNSGKATVLQTYTDLKEAETVFNELETILKSRGYLK
jgi:hypothetical protein